MASERPTRLSLESALRQQTTLLSLAAVNDASWEERLATLMSSDAATLAVARVSFWSLQEHPPSLRCEVLFQTATGRTESGAVLEERQFPRYFEALHTGRPVLAEDAHQDPRTSEFSKSYLLPNGIGAMLDVPVYLRGELVGVVCHEHVGGARIWSADEELFALSIAQLVSLAIEAKRRDHAEAALRASEARFRSMVDAAPFPLLVASYPDGLGLYGNEDAQKLVVASGAELVGRPVLDLFGSAAAGRELMVELGSAGRLTNRELLLRHRDGKESWALASLQRLDFGGKPAFIAGLWDLTVQKQLEDRLRHMAMHDPLTGLPNRALFLDLLRNELARAHRDPGHKFAVLFLDMDGFKQINDRHGHEGGDAVLFEMGRRLRAGLRATDTAARIGGDEFTILLTGVADEKEADNVQRRITRLLCEPVSYQKQLLHPRVSIGYALGDSHVSDATELLRQADDGMYRAKQAKTG